MSDTGATTGSRGGGLTVVIGAVAFALCRGAPLLIAAVATTGLGATLAAFGWPALGAAVAVAGIVGGVWWSVRGRGRMVGEPGRSRKFTRNG